MTEKRNSTSAPHDDSNDPDRPFTDDEFDRGLGAVLARRARQETGLTQAAFAERYSIPTASLRDWEQGRRAPDNVAQSYLRVIAAIPDSIAQALHDAALIGRNIVD